MVGKNKKTNYQVLKENRKAVLDYAEEIAKKPIPEATKSFEVRYGHLGRMIEDDDFTGAIKLLGRLKDNQLGIMWHESENLGNGTKALVRDARNVTLEQEKLTKDREEKYAMQILNETRAAIKLIEQRDPPLTKGAKELLITRLKGVASRAVASQATIEDLPKTVKEYNTELLYILEQGGVKDAAKALNFAKEVMSFDDEHRHIVTLTNAKDAQGKEYTVIEADIMLNGLTDAQEEQWEAIRKTTKEHPKVDISNMEWYTNMPPYQQQMFRSVASKILSGKCVIPTQFLVNIPGIKNAYQKVTAIKSNAEPAKPSVIVSQVLHSGTPATKIKGIGEAEKINIVEQNIEQLQGFTANGLVELNILTSTSSVVRDENFVQPQLRAASNILEGRGGGKPAIVASPVNSLRLVGGGRDQTVFRNRLKMIGGIIGKEKELENVGKFLREGNSVSENFLEKISPGIYKSTKTKALQEIRDRRQYGQEQLANDLEECIKATELLNKSFMRGKGNSNLNIVASMNIIENSLTLENGALYQKLSQEERESIPERVDFCKSGKDRTGYAQIKNTHAAVCHYLCIKSDSELGQDILRNLAAGGHTQEMAGIQGGTIGCHSIKTSLAGTSISKQDRVIEGIINQQSSQFNSGIKTVKNKGPVIARLKSLFDNSLNKEKVRLQAGIIGEGVSEKHLVKAQKSSKDGQNRGRWGRLKKLAWLKKNRRGGARRSSV